MKKFEYKVTDSEDEERLNQLGKEGWELVSVIYKSWEDLRHGGTDSVVVLYFKRELAKTIDKK